MAGGQTSSKPFFVGEIVRRTPEQLDEFVALASTGNEFVYCEAPQPIRDLTWLRAGELAREGLVNTHERRRQGGGKQYYLVRTARGLPERADPVALALVNPATAAIFLHLKRAANLGAPCPSDAELARRTGLNTRNEAQGRFQKLVNLGLVESVKAYEDGVPFRVVTIVAGPHAGSAGGKSTALPKKWAALQRAAERELRSAGGAS